MVEILIPSLVSLCIQRKKKPADQLRLTRRFLWFAPLGDFIIVRSEHQCGLGELRHRAQG